MNNLIDENIIYLRLALETEQEKANWRLIKSKLGLKQNTEILRTIIRDKAENLSK